MKRSLLLMMTGTLAVNVSAGELVNVLYESAFESSLKPNEWSGQTKLVDGKAGNHYLLGASASRAGNAPALASLEFPAVKGQFAVEFRALGLLENSHSVFFTLAQRDTPLFTLKTVNFRTEAVTIPGASSGAICRMHAKERWNNLRFELNTGNELDNLVAYANGRCVGLFTVPALYEQAVSRLSFGRLARIDDLRITSGKGTFNLPDNPDKLRIINISRAKQRGPEKAIPEGVDPLQLFLDQKPPEVVKEISDGAADGIWTREFTFLAREEKPEYALLRSEAYAVLCEPEKPGRYPGLLILHGGCGVAEASKARAWAEKGYVALAISLPGVSNPAKSVHVEGVARLPYAFSRFCAKPDAASCPFMDAFIAAVKACNYLAAQPNVDPERIGLTGISWGGFTTTAVAGLLGERLKAAFSVYGCGFLEESGMAAQIGKMPTAERARWLKHIDAGRRANGMHAHYFVVGPTNDSHFWPVSILRTLQAIPGETNQLLVPNQNHRARVPGGTDNAKGQYLNMETPYFAYHLKGEGKPFPKVVAKERTGNAGRRVRFTMTGPAEFRQPKVYYTMDTDPDWRKRTWHALEAKAEGGNEYSAPLPESRPNDLYWFAMASDARDITVSSRLQCVQAPR